MRTYTRPAAVATILVAAALLLTGCGDSSTDDAARAAIGASLKETGWTAGMTADQRSDAIDTVFSTAQLSCTAGGYTPGKYPQLGVATIAGMQVLCPDVLKGNTDD